jgi:LPXTG-motif cell wall-anchored protein
VVPQGPNYCGTVAANSVNVGQGSAPRTYEFRVTSGPSGGGRFFDFFVPDALPLPTIGSYVCGRFQQGVPMSGLLAWMGPSDPGYVVSTLPTTSTLPDTGAGLGIWLLLTGLAALAGVGLVSGRSRRAFLTY